MLITADTVNTIFALTQKDFYYKEVLSKYFKRKAERQEFESELWLYLFENPLKTIEVFNNGFFKYWFIAIVKKQVVSNKSSWHYQFRKQNFLLYDNPPEAGEEQNLYLQQEEQKEFEDEKQNKIRVVKEALNFYYKHDPFFLKEGKIFEMYFFDNLSAREIAEKIKGINHKTVWEHINYATVLVKHYIKKHHNKNI